MIFARLLPGSPWNLREQEEKHKKLGTYAACKYDDQTCEILKAWMTLWSIPKPIDSKDFHTTIIYSRQAIVQEHQRNMNDYELKILAWRWPPVSIGILKSSPKSLKRCLVLKLEAPELVNLHDALCRAGATHDFPTYEPHVTLSYDVPDDFDWKKIVLPPVYFIPSKIYFEPLDLSK